MCLFREIRACECSKEMHRQQLAEERRERKKDELQVCYQSKKKDRKRSEQEQK